MRRMALGFGCLALLAAACTDDDGSDITPSMGPGTTRGETTPGAPSTSSPASTTGPATVTLPPTATLPPETTVAGPLP